MYSWKRGSTTGTDAPAIKRDESQSDRYFLCSSLFLPPTKVDSVYDLLWLVGVNDFLLKFVAVIVKIGLIFIPGAVVPFPKRVSDTEVYRACNPLYYVQYREKYLKFMLQNGTKFRPSCHYINGLPFCRFFCPSPHGRVPEIGGKGIQLTSELGTCRKG